MPGAVLSMLGCSPKKRIGLILFAAWLLPVLAFSEEPLSLLKSLNRADEQFQTARRQGDGLRVITLNCGGGSKQAAWEVNAHDPDIVLLTESPHKKEVEELGRKMFGKEAGVLSGVDASIIVRGKVEPIQLDRISSAFFVAARVNLRTRDIYIVSARLTPPVANFNLLSSECWKEQKENRLSHKEQVRQLSELIRRIPSDAPLLMGGDMNCPAGDGALSMLHPRLRDTFRQGGRGWGNTVLNDFPVSRIDQIWASKHFQAVSVTAHKTRNSDHRMLIADLILHSRKPNKQEVAK